MEDHSSWLSDGKPQKTTKFINQLLSVDQEGVYIYSATRNEEGKYGKTLHYIFSTPAGEELIFDSKNPKIAEIFKIIRYGSRVKIKKVIKGGRIQYEVKHLNYPEDEDLKI